MVRRMRLLSVGTGPDLLDIIHNDLVRSGEFVVTISPTVHDALSALSDQSFDLVVSDHYPPDLDGIAFLKCVRDRFGDVPFILCTSPGCEELLVEAVNLGAEMCQKMGDDLKTRCTELSEVTRRATRRCEPAPALRDSRQTDTFQSVRPPIGLGVVQDCRFVYLNDQAVRVTGYSREEMYAMDLWDLVPPGERKGMEAAEGRWMQGDPLLSMHGSEFPTKSTEGRWAITSASGIDFDGRPASLVTIQETGSRSRTEGLLETCERIAEAHAQLQARFDLLTESEELFRKMFVASPDIIVRTDLEGKIVLINQKGAELAGWTDPADLVGKTVFSFFAPESLPAAIENTRLMFDGPLGPIEYTFIALDGRRIPLEVNGDVLYTPQAQPIGMVYFCRDVTERRQAEESLRQANKKLTILSGITRHDIRNRLLALNGFVEMMRQEVDDASLERIISQVEAASRQIEAMILFTGEYEQIGVHSPGWQAVRAVVDQAGESIGSAMITLENALPPDLEVFADPLISRVFFNLMDNAVRHGNGHSTIRFLVEEKDGTTVILCEDDGPGISPDCKERIFEPGFGTNSGYGLTISREILGITGISIRETGEVRRGARFEMTIPTSAVRRSTG